MNDTLYLTALPNGSLGDQYGSLSHQLRLSAFLTPSLDEGSPRQPFDHWPDWATDLKWTVTFLDSAQNLIGAPQYPASDPDSPVQLDSLLWNQVFGAVQAVHPRKGTHHLHHTWRLSHNITHLHHQSRLHRLSHAYQQLEGTGGSAVSVHNSDLNAATKAPTLFLHPQLKGDGDLALQFDDRTAVQSLWLGVKPASLQPLLDQRVGYAIDRLEGYGGAPLSAVSLCALYIFCLTSLKRPGATDPVIDPLCNTITGWPGAFKGQHATIDDVREHLLAVLFHNRTKSMRDLSIPPPPIDPPDFHQLLGLVQHYPAILRPLGLVFDFIVKPPATPPTYCSVGLVPNDPQTIKLAKYITVQPLLTRCTMSAPEFFATPRPAPTDQQFILHRMLNLNAKGTDTLPRFALVPENADGQALKSIDQTNNKARSSEYESSAPTAMNAPSPTIRPANSWGSTPPASTNPSGAPPAPRTVGLALFDKDRLIQLEKAAQATPPPGGMNSVPKELFAEDITLGYRVDVLYKGRFVSLCERASTYQICQPLSNHQLGTWKPTTRAQQSADEGFISFGATQSVLDPNQPNTPSNSQTQIHQAMFTWTGWSLSVPQPNLPKFNPPTTEPDPSKGAHLAIRPYYELKGKLPPLRFAQEPLAKDYVFRCRVVDLAGNSVGVETDPNNTQYPDQTLSPTPAFGRHEPIRAPQFLLLDPIDRKAQPGTHVDRLVARDHDDTQARVLIPPRESLRMAELSGKLSSPDLPPSAFLDQQLLDDGAFPSVACAKAKGWIAGSVDCQHDHDSIFLPNIEGDRPENPYYPDPLSNYIRVEVFAIADNPSQSQQIGLVWLLVNSRQDWPHRLPAQIRLLPDEGTGDPKVAQGQHPVERRRGPNVATLDITLPKARSVVLNISTSPTNGDALSEEWKKYPVALSNLHQVMIQHPDKIASHLHPQDSLIVSHLAQSLKQMGNPPQASDFLDGRVDLVSPKRTMTLVHAVKRPLEPPDFAPARSAGELRVIRDLGKPDATVTGALLAHWFSTGKITCYALWNDRVDDVTRKAPRTVHYRHVAFAVTSKDFQPDPPPHNPPIRLRTLNSGLNEHFTDTRAHTITYSLVAGTNFREYYPGAGKKDEGPEFLREGEHSVTLTVLSSVPPPAPPLLYVVPAFLWTDTYEGSSKTWYSGRTMLARAWLSRPFLVSGDRETLGVLLFDPTSGVAPADQQSVSRWGADPARTIIAPIAREELTEANLCEAEQPIENCTLDNGDKVRVKPCRIEYCEERQLWYADIPINTQGANAPFVRLALVRWQPDALSSPADARVSRVTFADFIQLSPDRWVSIQRLTHRQFAITVSGTFAPPDSNIPASLQPLSLTLYCRWFALGNDLGWRPLTIPVQFTYTPPSGGSNVASWSTQLELPHSAYTRKYRILLRETDWFADGTPGAQSYAQFIDLP